MPLSFLPEPSYSVLIDTPVSGSKMGKLVLSGEHLTLKTLKPKRDSIAISLEDTFGVTLSRHPSEKRLYLELRQQVSGQWVRLTLSSVIKRLEGIEALPPLIKEGPRISEQDFVNLLARLRAAMQERGFERWGVDLNPDTPETLKTLAQVIPKAHEERGLIARGHGLDEKSGYLLLGCAMILPLFVVFIIPSIPLQIPLMVLFFAFSILYRYARTLYVRVEGREIVVENNLFPTLSKRIDASHITQLYGEMYETSSKNGTKQRYRVRALLKVHGRTLEITQTDDELTALKVERYLETQLGIEDEWVHGEIFRVRKPPAEEENPSLG